MNSEDSEFERIAEEAKHLAMYQAVEGVTNE